MNVLPWLGWVWLLVVAGEGVYLVADYFFGFCHIPSTVRAAATSDCPKPGDSDTLKLVITLVAANALFVAAAREFGQDKPAITKLALFIAAAFGLIGAFAALYEAEPVLAALMLWTAWAGILVAYIIFSIVIAGRVLKLLGQSLRNRLP